MRTKERINSLERQVATVAAKDKKKAAPAGAFLRPFKRLHRDF